MAHEDKTAICVRQLQPGEWEVLRSLRLAAIADSPEAFGSTLARELAFDEAEWRRRAADSPIFIAWREDKPVGLVAVMCHPAGDGADSRPEWELMSMWVSLGARGSGLADLLVSAAVGAVRAESAGCLVLWVTDGNARARSFYVRAGFRPAGVQRRFSRRDGSEFDGEKLILRLDEER